MKKEGEEKKLVKLDPSDVPWGLISAILGNSKNRTAFARGLFPSNKNQDDNPEALGLWAWRTKMSEGIDPNENFKKIAAEFKDVQSKVELAENELVTLEKLWRVVIFGDREKWCAESLRSVSEHEALLDVANEKFQEIEAEREKLVQLLEEERLLGKTAPFLWRLLFWVAGVKLYKQRVRGNADAQILQHNRIKQYDERQIGGDRQKAQKALELAQEILKKREDEWMKKCVEYEEILQKYPDLSPPISLDDIETENVQKSGLWHAKAYAAQRSALFRKALELHEAWLLAVSVSGGGFGSNLFVLSDFLSGNWDGDDEAKKILWQSLFMIVPVVSCTFASFAHQFESLGSKSIGWLFIDEAGQAVPQAAVGALLRAKRAVVIGDPLQIEPVFTVPKRLIAEFAKHSLYTAQGAYSPDVVSAQVLADRANKYGANTSTQAEENIWIGSPLRVHRRCIDPMFSVSNAIAYENRMIFGLSERLPKGDKPSYFGPSSWIDLSGKASGLQAVPEQLDFVAKQIVTSYVQLGKLPDLFIISPFKIMKSELAKRLNKPYLWSSFNASKPKDLASWISARIGTVHTFQGKERDTVIMVLGADQEKLSSARWAASKPNLLNVAVTRAKWRIYIVGDRALWGKLPYFQNLAKSLPVVTPEKFEAAIARASIK